jgi:hypothetical protein
MGRFVIGFIELALPAGHLLFVTVGRLLTHSVFRRDRTAPVRRGPRVAGLVAPPLRPSLPRCGVVPPALLEAPAVTPPANANSPAMARQESAQCWQVSASAFMRRSSLISLQSSAQRWQTSAQAAHVYV